MIVPVAVGVMADHSAEVASVTPTSFDHSAVPSAAKRATCRPPLPCTPATRTLPLSVRAIA
jgi:hypothetical protein